MSYLCDLFFIFIIIFIWLIVRSREYRLANTESLFFYYCLEYVLLFLDDNVGEEYE